MKLVTWLRVARRPLPAVLLLLASALAAPASAAVPLGLPALTDEQVAAFSKADSQADAALQAADRPKAIRAYRRALAIQPANEGTWYNLACAQARSGQRLEAITSLRRASRAGWRDARWPTSDPDLSSLQNLPELHEWLASLGSEKAEPAMPAFDEADLATTPEGIEQETDAAKKEIARVRPALGTTQREGAQRTLTAWQVASWDLVASRRQGADRTAARFEALKVLAGPDATRLPQGAAARLEQRASAFLADEGDTPQAPAVRLQLAEARHAAARAQAQDDAQRAAADSAFERDLLVLAASQEEGDALQRALVRLVALNRDDLAEARLFHERLRREVSDPERLRTLETAANRSVHYRLEGLPDFEARTLDGRVVTRDSLRGHVTLVDFWATWCGPCREELPHVKEAYATYRDRGFEVIGISLDDARRTDEAAFKAWCAKEGVTWPQVYDGKFWDAALAKVFSVHAIPFPILVDRDGRVIATDEALRGDQLGKAVGALVDAAPPLQVGAR